MPKIKDIPKIDRPREKFLQKGADALSKSDLLAILLGSGIKGKNVRQLSESIIKKFGKNFLNITVDDLLEISGIGQAKALQIVSAISLVKRFYADLSPKDKVVLSAQDAIFLTSDIRDKKKEYLVCLYLNARNALLKKEVISIGILDKSIIHPREIFGPAVELRAAGIILLHNHPSGDVVPSKQDEEVINKILEAGKIMGVNVVDFIIVSENDAYSFLTKIQSSDNKVTHYVSDGVQNSIFDLLVTEQPAYAPEIKNIHKAHFYPENRKDKSEQLIFNKPFFDSKNGNVKIYQNDAISFLKSLPDNCIDLIITDPAYSGMNQMLKLGKGKIIGTYKEKGKNGAKWFEEFHDTEKNYAEFLKESKRVLKNDRHIYIMFDSYSLLSLAPIVRQIFDVKNILCWDKANIGLGHYFRRRHEFILFASKGKRHLKSKAIPDVWKIKRVTKMKYPTQKPTEVFELMIKGSTEDGFVVCDPFLGSGSAMIASIKNGCNFIGCDISEKSINISKQRAEEFFKSGNDILQPQSLLSDDNLTNKLF